MTHNAKMIMVCGDTLSELLENMHGELACLPTGSENHITDINIKNLLEDDELVWTASIYYVLAQEGLAE